VVDGKQTIEQKRSGVGISLGARRMKNIGFDYASIIGSHVEVQHYKSTSIATCSVTYIATPDTAKIQQLVKSY